MQTDFYFHGLKGYATLKRFSYLFEMTTDEANTLKQNITILQDALRDDLLKRDKPFVVVMDYQKYQLIEKYINKIANDETYRAIDNLENDKDFIKYSSKKELFDDLGL